MEVNKATGIFLSIVLLLLAGLKLAFLSNALFCSLCILLMLFVMVREILPPEISLLSCLSVLLLGDAVADKKFLPLERALEGFSSSSVLVVGALFIVAAAVKNLDCFKRLAYATLGNKANSPLAILRMALPVAGLSAFINNTPIVTIFMPIVREWAVSKKISPSKLLIPLSYLTAFGGVCTLIGTSTNILIDGLLYSEVQQHIPMFEFAKVGFPCAIIGLLYLFLFGHKLLPDRKDQLERSSENARQFILQMAVEAKSELIGKSIGETGLRDGDETFLVSIERGEHVFNPVRRDFILEEGDILFFQGHREAIVDLYSVNGLSYPSTCGALKMGEYSELIEVVVSTTSPIIGKTISDLYFNRKYDATVLGLHRNGEDILQDYNLTPLKAGDTLLLLSGFGFRQIWENSTDFVVVSSSKEELKKGKMDLFPVFVLMAMVGLSVSGLLPILHSALLAALVLTINSNLEIDNIFKHVEWKVLVVIASAFGLSAALNGSGASGQIAEQVVAVAKVSGPIGALVLIYVVTNVMTELMTNNAAAALVFPIAMSTAEKLGVSYMPFVMAIAIASSASFSTPIGYQTNMIVYGPGGYKYTDYLKVGIPLNIIFCIGTCIAAPIVWPF